MKSRKDRKVRKQINLLEASSSDQEKNTEVKQQEWMGKFVKQEIAKAMKTTQAGKEVSANFITSDFPGMTNYNYHRETRNSWIIDTSASNHICTQHELHSHISFLTTPINVHLPNGNSSQVAKIGNISLNQLKLTEVFFLPQFSHNLFSVNKLITTNFISCTFYPFFCILQD